MEDKHKNDKYDREKYIPKGYILPDGEMLTKKYARLHEDMAKKFVHENYHERFEHDIISTEKDFMLMRLDALQVLSFGRPIVVYAKGNNNKIIQDAIVSYLGFGWKENVLENPYGSFFDYMRCHLLNGFWLPYNKSYREMELEQLVEKEEQLKTVVKYFDKKDKIDKKGKKEILKEIKKLEEQIQLKSNIFQ